MSTELVRSMSIDFKNLKQNFSVASSNVSPKHYEKVTLNGISDRMKEERFNVLSDKEKFLYSLLFDLSGGMIHLQKSVSSKYRYAYVKMIEKRDEIYNENQDDFIDRYGHSSAWNVMHEATSDGKCNLHNVKKVIEAYVEALNEKDEKISKVINFNGNYIYRINPTSVRYTYNKRQAKHYTSLKKIKLDIMELNSMFSDMEISMEDI